MRRYRIYTPRLLTIPDEGGARGRYSKQPRRISCSAETPDVNSFVIQLANHNAEFLLRHPAVHARGAGADGTDVYKPVVFGRTAVYCGASS